MTVKMRWKVNSEVINQVMLIEMMQRIPEMRMRKANIRGTTYETQTGKMDRGGDGVLDWVASK